MTNTADITAPSTPATPAPDLDRFRRVLDGVPTSNQNVLRTIAITELIEIGVNTGPRIVGAARASASIASTQARSSARARAAIPLVTSGSAMLTPDIAFIRVERRGLDESDQRGNKQGMDTPSPLALASLVLTAPGWVRVGIAAPNHQTREAAALELGSVIADRIVRPVEVVPEGQMTLPL